MKYISFRLSGRYGHFKKPETNNNPLTYPFMHKPALIGLTGAVVGVNRPSMKKQFPGLCDGLGMALVLNKPVTKETHGFTSHKAVAGNFYGPGRVYNEFLRGPDYTVTIALKNDSCNEFFSTFCCRIKNKKSGYPHYFGISSCPAQVSFLNEGSLAEEKGLFKTTGIISSDHELKTIPDDTDIGTDRIPTYQDNNWYNPPDRFVSVLYYTGVTVEAFGSYYKKDNGECLWLI